MTESLLLLCVLSVGPSASARTHALANIATYGDTFTCNIQSAFVLARVFAERPSKAISRMQLDTVSCAFYDCYLKVAGCAQRQLP